MAAGLEQMSQIANDRRSRRSVKKELGTDDVPVVVRRLAEVVHLHAAVTYCASIADHQKDVIFRTAALEAGYGKRNAAELGRLVERAKEFSGESHAGLWKEVCRRSWADRYATLTA